MTNHQNQEIKRKIRDLEDKIHDCKTYISSDFCVSCNEMYENIKKYENEIKTLKEFVQD
jgi:peptidoglycan hydrolase CwlO-like protein